MVLVLDKGNIRSDNFIPLKGKIKWVGSLVLSHFSDLGQKSLNDYEGVWKDYKYHRCQREVMGIDCILILTYCEKLAHKQEHSLQKSIDKLINTVKIKWAEYKRKPRKTPKGITNLIEKHRYGKYLSVSCLHYQPVFELTQAYDSSQQFFGKTLLESQ